MQKRLAACSSLQVMLVRHYDKGCQMHVACLLMGDRLKMYGTRGGDRESLKKLLRKEGR